MARTSKDITSKVGSAPTAKTRTRRTAKPKATDLAPTGPTTIQQRNTAFSGITEAQATQHHLATTKGAEAPDPAKMQPSNYSEASSSLPGMDRATADAALEQIARQGNESEVIAANIDLSTKLEGLKTRIAKLAGAKVRTSSEVEKITTELIKHDSQIERSSAAHAQLLNQKLETEGIEGLAQYLRHQKELKHRLEEIKITELEAKIARRLASSEAYIEDSPHQEL